MNARIDMPEREVVLLTDAKLDAVSGGSLKFSQTAVDDVIKTIGDGLGKMASKG
jgi:hypothetical protein